MRSVFICLLLIAAKATTAQISVGLHHSSLPFFSINYEGKSRFVPELRIGTNSYLDDTGLEGVLLYHLMRRDEVTLYAGLGVRAFIFSSFVVPVGVNVYPFAAKNFGFHLELAPLISESTILRGSWGIRYRFGRKTAAQ